MKIILNTAIAATIGLAVVSCGGSKSSPAPASNTPTTKIELSGQAIKGTIDKGEVFVFRANNLVNPVAAAVSTDALGNYTFTLDEATSYKGAYIIEVVAAAGTTMICDAKPMCGDVDFGDKIPADKLTGLSLSSVTTVDETGKAKANVNLLTTLTTDVLITAAKADGVNLSSVSKETLDKLQMISSEIVGDLIGVDLSTKNVFDIEVVDATTYTANSTPDVTIDTLSVINASYAGLPLADDETMADSIAVLTANVQAMSVVLLDPEFKDEDLLTEIFVAAKEALTATLETAAVVRQDIQAALPNPDIVILEVTTVPDVDAIVEKIEEADTATGSTGSVSE